MEPVGGPSRRSSITEGQRDCRRPTPTSCDDKGPSRGRRPLTSQLGQGPNRESPITEHVEGKTRIVGPALAIHRTDNNQARLTGEPVHTGCWENASRSRGASSVARVVIKSSTGEMAELFGTVSKVAQRTRCVPVRGRRGDPHRPPDDNRDDRRPVPAAYGGARHRNQWRGSVLKSGEAARRLGVPEEKWVYLHGHAD